MRPPSIHVTSFYRFMKLNDSQINALKAKMETLAAETGLLGLCLIGAEGLNATFSGSAQAIAGMKELVSSCLNLNDIVYKDSLAMKAPFHAFRIKVKDEIVTLGKPGFMPDHARNNHLSPEEWHVAIQNPEAVILDTRNDYEVHIGKFKGARDFALKEFREFPEAVAKSGIDKDSPVLMYCTGGIRCEKAILEMNAQGYKNVHQLDGGILNYLERFPSQSFEGECFVFDYRVALDQHLQPTRNYKLCPHCGQPANTPVTCVKCGTETVICENCKDSFPAACSKNCAHHVKIGSSSKRSHRQELNKRHKTKC